MSRMYKIYIDTNLFDHYRKINNSLSVVKFLGESKLYAHF